jgi:extradiol dioxygenase family protein
MQRLHKVVVRSKKDWLRFCNALKLSGVAGVAACLVRGITYKGDHRIQQCIFYKAICGNRTVSKKYCREYLKEQHTCI